MFPFAQNRHHNTSQRWHTLDLGHVFPRTARSATRSVPTVNEEFRDCSHCVLIVLTAVVTHTRAHKTTNYCQDYQPLSNCFTLLPVESFILGIELNLDQSCIDLLATITQFDSGHLVRSADQT